MTAVEHARLARRERRHVDALARLGPRLHHRLAGVERDERRHAFQVLLDQAADARHQLAALRRRDHAPSQVRIQCTAHEFLEVLRRRACDLRSHGFVGGIDRR